MAGLNSFSSLHYIESPNKFYYYGHLRDLDQWFNFRVARIGEAMVGVANEGKEWILKVKMHRLVLVSLSTCYSHHCPADTTRVITQLHPVQPNTKHCVLALFSEHLQVHTTESLRSKWRRAEIWKTFPAIFCTQRFVLRRINVGL